MRARTRLITLAFGIVGVVAVLIAFLQTRPDVSKLADEVLRNTPEHIHFASNTTFSWCLFRPPREDPLPELTQAVLAKLRSKYIVYLSDSEIPDTQKLFRDGKLVAYENGFSFEVRVEMLSPRRVKIQYLDWEGNLAGSTHYEVYKWTGRFWRVVEKSRTAVA